MAHGLFSWENDFAQELRLRALEAGEEEALCWTMRYQCSVIAGEWFGRSKSGRLRFELPTDPETMRDLVSVAPVTPCARIAWANLREVWPRLTNHERAGVWVVVTGAFERPTAEELGTTRDTLSRATRNALALVDSPRVAADAETRRLRSVEANQSRKRTDALRKHVMR